MGRIDQLSPAHFAQDNGAWTPPDVPQPSQPPEPREDVVVPNRPAQDGNRPDIIVHNKPLCPGRKRPKGPVYH